MSRLKTMRERHPYQQEIDHMAAELLQMDEATAGHIRAVAWQIAKDSGLDHMALAFDQAREAVEKYTEAAQLTIAGNGHRVGWSEDHVGRDLDTKITAQDWFGMLMRLDKTVRRIEAEQEVGAI